MAAALPRVDVYMGTRTKSVQELLNDGDADKKFLLLKGKSLFCWEVRWVYLKPQLGEYSLKTVMAELEANMCLKAQLFKFDSIFHGRLFFLTTNKL